MMEIKNYTIPDLTLSNAEDIIDIINNEFDGSIKPEKEEDLAALLGHETANSGAFRSKLSALKKYKLIEGWGEKELTSRAYKLLEGKDNDVVVNIIHEFEFFSLLYNEFGNTVPRYQEWGEFLKEEMSIELSDIRSPRKAWKIYTDLIKRIPDEDKGNNKTDGDFDEKDFMEYLEMSDNYKNKRKYAIKAIKNLTSDPPPSEKPIDEILIRLKENKYPDHKLELLTILRQMCEYNDVISGEKRREIESQILDLVTNITGNPKKDEIRQAEISLKILEELNDSGATPPWSKDLWDSAQQMLIDGANHNSEWSEAYRLTNLSDNIVKQLIGPGSEWADDQLKNEIEEDIWDRIGEQDIESEYYEEWLKQMDII